MFNTVVFLSLEKRSDGWKGWRGVRGKPISMSFHIILENLKQLKKKVLSLVHGPSCPKGINIRQMVNLEEVPNS